MHCMRALFPAEVTGLIVAMAGLTVVELSVTSTFGITEQGQPLQPMETAVALFTLATMVGLNVWSKNKAKRFCIVIGMAAGYALCQMVGLLARFPKLGTVSAVMPRPVMGATLIFAVSFMIVAGIQTIMSRMMDARQTFEVGISSILGLGVDIVPHPYTGLPNWLYPLFSSSEH
ncbi:solute carrier family 23 protein [Desulfoplanes sp.]